MSKAPDISDAEWAVMSIVWQRSPITSQEIVDALTPDHDWNPRTIRTLVNRLVKKGALGFKTEGKRYLYLPKVKQQDCIRKESRSFLSRVFGGALAPMLAHFVEDSNLTPEQLAELKKILDQKRGQS